MPGLPVVCQHCQHAFESRLIVVQGSVINLSIYDCSEPCPNCGKQTGLLHGRFNYKNGVLELIEGPQITIDALKKVQAIVAEAGENEPQGAVESQIDQATGQSGFIQKMIDWANRAGYAIDTVKDWRGRILFIAWITREILGALDDR